jgi:hypothetical protein
VGLQILSQDPAKSRELLIEGLMLIEGHHELALEKIGSYGTKGLILLKTPTTFQPMLNTTINTRLSVGGSKLSSSLGSPHLTTAPP